VNTSRKWYQNDPFILCSQANQVFYLPDTDLGGHWRVVQKLGHRNIYDIPEVVQSGDKEIEEAIPNEAYQETESFQLFVDFGDYDLIPLHRNDVEPETVNASTEVEEMVEEDDFIDDESDEEEATTDEEEVTTDEEESLFISTDDD
jgi:hypothetical protein